MGILTQCYNTSDLYIPLECAEVCAMSRFPESRQPLNLSESADELKATLAARRELSSEMEDVLIKNFLQQLERQIDAHIDRRLADKSQSRVAMQKQTTALISSILGISIPLVVLAGIFGGGAGIGAVCAVILVVSLVALFRS